MKYFILGLIILITPFSCWMVGGVEYDKIKINIFVSGTKEAHIIINKTDYGYVGLPFEKMIFYNDRDDDLLYHLYAQVYSDDLFTFELFENDILIYSTNNNYVEYRH